jgi:hypothetical protein
LERRNNVLTPARIGIRRVASRESDMVTWHGSP